MHDPAKTHSGDGHDDANEFAVAGAKDDADSVT